MGPKKKLRYSKRLQSKQLEISGTASHSAESTGQSNVEVPYLYRLPNEVLLKIYELLSQVDQLSLSQVGDKRVEEVSYFIRDVDFSNHRHISSHLVTSVFNESRSMCIQRLNFNYNMYLKPSSLTKIICQCTNLVFLSVVECGITDVQIAEILAKCPKLEELVWSLKEFTKPITCQSDSLKQLYLICDTFCSCAHRNESLQQFKEFLKWFRNIEKIFYYFDTDFMLGSNIMGLWSRACFVSPNNSDGDPTIQIFVINNTPYYQLIKDTVNPSVARRNDRHLWRIMFVEGPRMLSDFVYSYCLYDSPPYLAVKISDYSSSDSDSDELDTYSSLQIHLTDDIAYGADDFAEHVFEDYGLKLNYLCLRDDEGLHEETAIPIRSFLEKICFTCTNITTLDITTIHFDCYSPFKAICQLKNLKSLSIGACTFFNEYSPIKWPNEEYISFEEVVSSCPNVNSFTFICCSPRHKKFMNVSEDDMKPMENWKELKQLAIFSSRFKTCRFLRNVACSCKKLESFFLHTDETEQVGRCIFVYDVIYLLQRAKNLSFISINCKTFNPMVERLWKTIGGAANLQGICIMTKYATRIEKKVVLDAVKKLRHLHLFHLNTSSKDNESLDSDIKKSMASNGIVNAKLSWGPSGIWGYQTLYLEYPRKESYHKQPLFYCQELHLNDVCV